tara:strand:- start:406 stop:618 length:213 start_codon:yes stop_codon:yes gene_type:complete
MSFGEIILYLILTIYILYCLLIFGSFCYYELLPAYIARYIRRKTYDIINIEIPPIDLETIEEIEEEEEAF